VSAFDYRYAQSLMAFGQREIAFFQIKQFNIRNILSENAIRGAWQNALEQQESAQRPDTP
jgi:hypothetical protein